MKARLQRSAAFLTVIATVAWAVVASGSPRVLLVGPSASDAAVVRLRDELLVLGLAVEMVVGARVTDLPSLVRERGAEAGVLVQASPPDVLVWVDAARIGGATAPEPVTHEATAAGSGSDLGLLALRAIETVRARLLPLPERPGEDAGAADVALSAPQELLDAAARLAPAIPARAAVVPPGAEPDRAHDRAGSPESARRRASAFAGPALLASPGGAPVGLQVEAVARIPVLRSVDLEIATLLPTWPMEVGGEEGLVRLRVAAFGVGLDLPLSGPTSRFHVDLGLGIGGLLLVFDGEARPPYRPAEGARLAVLPWLRGGAAYAFVPAVRLRADVLLGVARPEPVVRAGGRVLAAIEAPVVVPALGVEIAP